MIRNSPDKGEENIQACTLTQKHERTRKMSKYFLLLTMPRPITQTFLMANYLTSLLIYELGNNYEYLPHIVLQGLKKMIGTSSLVAQWLRIRLPMQGTRVRALIRKDPTCCGATKPVRHNYWACALEPASHNCWAHVPQLLKPACLEPVLHKRSHRNEKPAHHKEE